MAKTVSITKDLLRKSAFEMAREQGVNEVTARKLAAYAGCSTQPIFRNYANMEDCLNDVYEDTLLYFDEFYNKYDKGSHIPFVNLGMAYISFAEKEPKLFSFLFMTRNISFIVYLRVFISDNVYKDIERCIISLLKKMDNRITRGILL